jgi:hypothetical protein
MISQQLKNPDYNKVILDRTKTESHEYIERINTQWLK